MGGKVSSRSLLQILSLSSNFLSKEYNSYCVAANGSCMPPWCVSKTESKPILGISRCITEVPQYSTPVSQKITRGVTPLPFAILKYNLQRCVSNERMAEQVSMATKATKYYSVDRNDSVALGDLSGMPSAADLRGIPSAASSACLGIRTGRVGGRPVIPE